VLFMWHEASEKKIYIGSETLLTSIKEKGPPFKTA